MLTKKQRKSSRARCGSRRNFSQRGNPTYIMVENQPVPMNRVAKRHDRAADRQAYGAEIRKDSRKVRMAKTKKARRLLAQIRKKTRRLMKQRAPL